ncbi:hydroxyacid dehydrogenase [Brevibacillus fulvus]|uniref:D-3-phosphoglycerate dehydrogenase n=1 Tax=Brevibacillus fulvus TaxID=1125967 RepID=A0A939BTX8_9BACL|nr:hydroxyacid dehydrogenase [Brevibacillus fulvus]MBM7588931.1 D-3-phosphoglycerate dehydrogenase [Brevibacillus fulvus]
MSKPKILQILPMYHSEGERILRQGGEVIRTDQYDISHLCEQVKEVQAIVLRAPARITAEIIDAAPHLRVISGAGVGLDNIDVDYASQKNIPVLHAPAINQVSTAEHAIALLLALGKQLLPFHQEMSKGRYHARTLLQTHELRGKQVALIGFGRIAQEVAKRLKLGFEMDVRVWVRHFDKDKHGLAEQLGLTVTTDLNDLLPTADFVSLHVPLTDQTRGMFGREQFQRMKPTAYLINTARGAVVNQQELYQALAKKQIAGAGLDVFDPEPTTDADLPLLSLPNVIVTPHVGGTTVEANYLMATAVARNVLKVLAGERPDHLANPEIFHKFV